MSVIYEPRGAAAEYAPLAANLYRGCAHGCTYCYAPACLRMARTEFSTPTVRAGILDKLKHDLPKFEHDPRPILLSFTSDPYQPLEEKEKVTRAAVDMLGRNGNRVRILTKNPTLALRDLDLFQQHDVHFGVSLSWADDADRAKWEPNAGTVEERLKSLRTAEAASLRTWLSIEPVIDPLQALDVIDATRGAVHDYKIGKLNHDPAREKTVDWLAFATEAIRRVQAGPGGYYIKDDLYKHCKNICKEVAGGTVDRRSKKTH